MGTPRERILIVESDPDISDLICRQALRPLGYDTLVVLDAASAIRQAAENPPDLILANLNLPDLSGTDLLTALAAQRVRAPVVIVAEKGQERRVIQAFRLGATDAIFWPARDAEVVRVVERALQLTRGARLRHDLDRRLRAMQQQLERKSAELEALMAISKSVPGNRDRAKLLMRMLDAVVQSTQPDAAWFLVRDDRTATFVLEAHRNLPAAWAKKLGQPVDDGLSSVVALSGQTLTIHGRPLEKFKVSALGKSAAVLPVKVQDEVLALLIVVWKADREVEKPVQISLEAIVDLAAIALMNVRLFRAVQESTETIRLSERRQDTLLESLRAAVRDELRASMFPLEALAGAKAEALTGEQKQALKTLQASFKRLARLAERRLAPNPLKSN